MLRRCSLLVMCVLLFVAGLSPVAAQSAGSYPLLLIPVGNAGAKLPTNTVVSSATDADGNVIDTCLWSIGTKPSGCTMSVPRGETITVSVDESTLPAGVVVTNNDQSFTVPMNDPMTIGDMEFHFEFADSAEPETTVPGASTPDQPRVSADDELSTDPASEAAALPRTGTGPVFAQILHVLELVFGEK